MKPVEPQSLLDFDLGEGESSDDSDFRIEDHPEESDDYSINTDDEEKSMYSWLCVWLLDINSTIPLVYTKLSHIILKY